MSKAHLASITTFLLSAVAALWLAATTHSPLGPIGTFVVVSLAGAIVAGRLFAWLATPEEKRRDLEDRVRNPDI